jgi:hypothetical protein
LIRGTGPFVKQATSSRVPRQRLGGRHRNRTFFFWVGGTCYHSCQLPAFSTPDTRTCVRTALFRVFETGWDVDHIGEKCPVGGLGLEPIEWWARSLGHPQCGLRSSTLVANTDKTERVKLVTYVEKGTRRRSRQAQVHWRLCFDAFRWSPAKHILRCS